MNYDPISTTAMGAVLIHVVKLWIKEIVERRNGGSIQQRILVAMENMVDTLEKHAVNEERHAEEQRDCLGDIKQSLAVLNERVDR